MTTVTSVEELEGLADGTVLTVGVAASGNTRSWTKQGGVLVNGEFRLAPQQFAADLRRGVVTIGPRVVAMRPLSNNTRYVYIPLLHEGDNWLCGRYRDNSFRETVSVAQSTLEQMQPATSFEMNGNRETMLTHMARLHNRHQDEVRRHEQDVTAWRAEYDRARRERDEQRTARRTVEDAQRTAEAEATRLRARVAELEAQPATAPAAPGGGEVALRQQVAQTVDEYLRDQRFTWDGSTLGRMMANIGITQPTPETETVNVAVTVSGSSAMEVQPDTLGMPSGVTVSGVTTDWTVVLTIPKEVEVGNCACDDVTSEDIEAGLTAKGLRWIGDWSADYSCPND